MALPVSLDTVAEELSILSDESSAFINRMTGEVVTLSHEDIALIEEGDPEEADLPDWQVKQLQLVRTVLEGNDWAALPSKFDVHEWEIMRKFADDVEDDELGDRLQNAIHGKGAFRMFRATIEQAGERDAWFAFKHRALCDIARDALEELGIPYE